MDACITTTPKGKKRQKKKNTFLSHIHLED